MTNKRKNLVRWVPSALAAFLLIMSASYKLSNPPEIVELFTKSGLMQYVKLLAGLEVLFTILFLYPRTMKIGFLFITAYLGGAMATEMVTGSTMVAPTMILTLVWIGAYLRQPALFWGTVKRNEQVHSHAEV